MGSVTIDRKKDAPFVLSDLTQGKAGKAVPPGKQIALLAFRCIAYPSCGQHVSTRDCAEIAVSLVLSVTL